MLLRQHRSGLTHGCAPRARAACPMESARSSPQDTWGQLRSFPSGTSSPSVGSGGERGDLAVTELGGQDVGSSVACGALGAEQVAVWTLYANPRSLTRSLWGCPCPTQQVRQERASGSNQRPVAWPQRPHLPAGREGAGFHDHCGEADRWETVAMENRSWSSSQVEGHARPGHARPR